MRRAGAALERPPGPKEMLLRFQAVLFDLDGTLLDTLEDLANAMNKVLESRGVPVHPVEAYRLMVGDGVENLVKRALPEAMRDPQNLALSVAAMREEYSRNWALRTRPYPGVPQLLDGLSSKEVPMAVLSNKPHDFTERMVAEMLGSWRFQVVLGERLGVPRKPDPTAALQIASQLGIPPRDFVYLGDTDTDMRTAVAAGMFPVGALWGFRTARELLSNGARRLLRTPQELLELL